MDAEMIARIKDACDSASQNGHHCSYRKAVERIAQMLEHVDTSHRSHDERRRQAFERRLNTIRRAASGAQYMKPGESMQEHLSRMSMILKNIECGKIGGLAEASNRPDDGGPSGPPESIQSLGARGTEED